MIYSLISVLEHKPLCTTADVQLSNLRTILEAQLSETWGTVIFFEFYSSKLRSKYNSYTSFKYF